MKLARELRNLETVHMLSAMILQIGLLCACYVPSSREIINSPVASVLLKHIKSESDLARIGWVLV